MDPVLKYLNAAVERDAKKREKEKERLKRAEEEKRAIKDPENAEIARLFSGLSLRGRASRRRTVSPRTQKALKAREELRRQRQKQAETRQSVLTRVDQVAFFSCCHSGHLAPLQQLFRAGLVHQGLGDATPIVDLGKDRLVNGLHVACVAGNREVALELVGRGFDVDRRSAPDGRTALVFAVERGHAELAAALLRVGASVNLHLACFLSEDEEGLEGLADADVEVLEAFSGCTALHVAARTGRLDLVNLLLSHGARVDALNEMRMTALHLAGSREVAEALCSAGADPTGPCDDNGERPVDAARRRGAEDVAGLLSSLGADEWVSAAPDPGQPLSDADLVVKFWFGPREHCPKCKSSKLAEEVTLAPARGPHSEGVHSYRCRRCAWVGRYAFDERMVPRYVDTARWVPPAWRRRYACKGGKADGDDQVVPLLQRKKHKKKEATQEESAARGTTSVAAAAAALEDDEGEGEEEEEEDEKTEKSREAVRVETLLSTAGPASSSSSSSDEGDHRKPWKGEAEAKAEAKAEEAGEEEEEEGQDVVEWPYHQHFGAVRKPVRNSTLVTIYEESSVSTLATETDGRLRTTWGKLVTKEESFLSTASSDDGHAFQSHLGPPKANKLKTSPQVERVNFVTPPMTLVIDGVVSSDFRSPPKSAFVTITVHRKETYRVFTSAKFAGQATLEVHVNGVTLDKGKLCTIEIWDEVGDSEDQLLGSLKVFPENLVHGSIFQFRSTDGGEGPEMQITETEK